MTKSEELTTLLTMGVLLGVYLVVGVVCIRYAHKFLIVQGRINQTLLTVFYIFSILICCVRVLSYATIIITYFIKNAFPVGLTISLDILCCSLIPALGIA